MNDMTKTCGMCFMQIPAQARKCPHCQHFQNKMSLVMFHPAFGVIFAIIPLALMLIVFLRIFDTGKDFQVFSNQVEVAESKMAFGEDKSGGMVAVMGTIKNASPVPWKDIRFQVEFQDASGTRSDTGQKEEYSYYLPANSSLSFKVSFRRQFPETNYVSHTIRVISAKDGRTRW